MLVAGCPAAEVEGSGGSSSDTGGSSPDETSSGSSDASSSGGAVDESDSSSGDSTGCIERTWYPDEDGDGWGDANGAAPVVACEGPEGWVDVPDDCDDAEPLRNPSQDELCGDGLDNDCDDTEDEWSPSNLECNGCMAIGSGDALYVCPGHSDAQSGYEHCAVFGATLASVHGGEDNDLLAGLMGDAGVSRAYLGFAFDGRAWGWSEEISDGSVVNYDNWGDGFPEGAAMDETCAVMVADGTWAPAACADAMADAVLCRDDQP